MYAVCVGVETIIVSFANVTFVADTKESVPVHRLSAYSNGITCDALRQNLVLEDALYDVYLNEG